MKQSEFVPITNEATPLGADRFGEYSSVTFSPAVKRLRTENQNLNHLRNRKAKRRRA